MLEALALALRARPGFSSCRLLHEDSSWWRHAHWDAYRPVFGRIDAINKVPACRGLRDLPRHFRALKARQEHLAALAIQPGDAIVCLAGITNLANALASAYPAVNKVLCVTLKKYVDASRPADFIHYRHTTSGWLQNRFLEPASGVGRTLHLKPWRSRGGDGVRLERLQASLEETFQAIVVLSQSGRELPPGVNGQVTAAPFPHLHDLRELLPAPAARAEQERLVVFFGTPFLLVRNLPPEVYVEILNRCLDFLREHYGGRCRLLYRPHPAEKEEPGRLRLDGFTVENDAEVAELYFLRHAQNIEAVYSVSSTVSRAACNYGLNGYCFWRCFPFAPSAAAYFESLMGQVPPACEIRSLAQAPVPYEREPASSGMFASAVLRAIPGDSRPENPFAPPLQSPL